MFRVVKIKITIVTLITSYTNLATLKLDTHSSLQTLINFTRTLLTFRFVIASMRSMVFDVLTIFFVFLSVRGPARYKNTQCYFSVGLPRTVCAFVSLTLDNILQKCVPRNTVAKFYIQTASYCSHQMISLDYYHPVLEGRRILRVGSHFNLSVLANETLRVSLCREIDNVFGAVRTCFDHVLSKFSGFSWERILFLKSACVNMVMQIQV